MAIADFIGTFIYNVFQEGIGQATIDKAIEIAENDFRNADCAYQPTLIKEVIEC